MNKLALAIVNEGSDYEARKAVAQMPYVDFRFRRWAERVSLEAGSQRRAFDETFTMANMTQAVLELDEYYQAHVQELEA